MDSTRSRYSPEAPNKPGKEEYDRIKAAVEDYCQSGHGRIIDIEPCDTVAPTLDAHSIFVFYSWSGDEPGTMTEQELRLPVEFIHEAIPIFQLSQDAMLIYTTHDVREASAIMAMVENMSNRTKGIVIPSPFPTIPFRQIFLDPLDPINGDLNSDLRSGSGPDSELPLNADTDPVTDLDSGTGSDLAVDLYLNSDSGTDSDLEQLGVNFPFPNSGYYMY
ncbi:hypothetical protein H4R33_004553 [Dimargaris cristalligena]|nr:hypothetical protein H4R33_004553 [Dimargaris cristalligena]